MGAGVWGKSSVWTGKCAGVGGNFPLKTSLAQGFLAVNWDLQRRDVSSSPANICGFPKRGHGSGSISMPLVVFYGRPYKVTCAWLIFSFVLFTLCANML